MAHLELNAQSIAECRKLASRIVSQVKPVIARNTTVSIERAVLRLIGVEGSIKNTNRHADMTVPLPNFIVDQIKGLSRGVLYWFANGMIQAGAKTPNELAAKIAGGAVCLNTIDQAPLAGIQKKAQELARIGFDLISQRREVRNSLRKNQGDPMPAWDAGHQTKPPPPPLKYVIVATGNIFEDVIQASAAAQAGAEAIAVIRSTAQSLLDYVPEGATTEGFGGTYATQENFKIMRQALDEVGDKIGRYIRLTNYCSGLCMSEIAAMAALERLDFLLNDAMYGILFRDINMKRTLIDQNFSRMIIAHADIVIHTGEDNYLTTADAIENGHQVLASQFINERFALEAHMKEEKMGLGHAAEMDPWHPNVLLLEIARAQMTRDIFPKSPIKFMPPTKHMSGDIFFSHILDAMFNLVSVTTNQGIHLLGMPTEAMHTPLLVDRYMSIKSANYIFNAARDLGKEITFDKNGIIVNFANKVLGDTLELLRRIDSQGLFKAIEARAFANVSRTETGGKGFDGVIAKDKDYVNPFFELF